MSDTNYLVATIKPWNVAAFRQRTPALPGSWRMICERDDLTLELIERFAPRYVFFPHWSWPVPRDVRERADCVCFHMTDLPYGRGGSPLQNLISLGHESTVVSAIRMVEELDAGPVYCKVPLALDGRAQDIYERAAELVFDLIGEIVRTGPVPAAQSGEATTFKRRKPEASVLPETGSSRQIYDHIRMLDAETYPPAFLDHGDFRIEFSHAALEGDAVSARAVLRRRGQE